MRVTAEKMADWLKRGLTVREAASEAGVTKQAILRAEDRLGVTLRRIRVRDGALKHDRMADETGHSDTRVRAWSASPAAIARALDRAAAEKTAIAKVEAK